MSAASARAQASWVDAKAAAIAADRAAAAARLAIMRVDGEYVGLYYEWAFDIVGFAKAVLGVDLWAKQKELARALMDGDRVACKSGHKIGKSIFAAVAAWWWAATRGRAKVTMTSSSDRQVRLILWHEVKAVHRRHLQLIADGKLDPKYKLPAPLELPGLGVQWPDGRSIIGFSTSDQEKMAGTSSDHNFYICDEASGIKDAIFDAIEGNLAGGGKIFMISNPTQTVGYFYDAFHKNKGEWAIFTISSEETPNCVEGRKVIPGLAERHFVDAAARRWGKDSARYAIRVRGEFPAANDNSVVPIGLVEGGASAWEDVWDRFVREKAEGGDTAPSPRDAQDWVNATPESERGYALVVGVDVARYGSDETVVCIRRGKWVAPLLVYNQLDTQQVAGRVVAESDARRANGNVVVLVDSNGVGAGVADALRAMELWWIEVVDVVASERASNSTEYANKRAEMAFAVAGWLKDGGMQPRDDELEDELVVAQYRFDRTGRIIIESKDDIKARLGRSPDRGDAFGLCVIGGNPENDGSVLEEGELRHAAVGGRRRW